MTPDLVSGTSVLHGLRVRGFAETDVLAEITHLDRTTVGEGLLAFPRTYMRWALEAFIDPRVLAEPLSAHG